MNAHKWKWFSLQTLSARKIKCICSPEKKKVPPRSKLVSFQCPPPHLLLNSTVSCKQTFLHTSWLTGRAGCLEGIAADKVFHWSVSLFEPSVYSTGVIPQQRTEVPHLAQSPTLKLFKSIWTSTKSFSLHIQLWSAEGPPRALSAPSILSASKAAHQAQGNVCRKMHSIPPGAATCFVGWSQSLGLLGYVLLQMKWRILGLVLLPSFKYVSNCFEATTSPSLHGCPSLQRARYKLGWEGLR